MVFQEQINLVMYNLNFIQKLIKTHAEYEKDNECCGLIGLNNLKEIQVVPCENTHFDKKKHFEISPKSFKPYTRKDKRMMMTVLMNEYVKYKKQFQKFSNSSANTILPTIT